METNYKCGTGRNSNIHLLTNKNYEYRISRHKRYYIRFMYRKKIGSKNTEEWLLEQREKITKGFKAVDKLRKELCLANDPIYRDKR